jgi:hypothetical protein
MVGHPALLLLMVCLTPITLLVASWVEQYQENTQLTLSLPNSLDRVLRGTFTPWIIALGPILLVIAFMV